MSSYYEINHISRDILSPEAMCSEADTKLISTFVFGELSRELYADTVYRK